MARKVKTKVMFRDARGRFVSPRDRYTKAVVIQARRRGYTFDLVDTRLTPDLKITPQVLSVVLTGDEFNQLPEALIPFRGYKSNKKYRAWDIAEQIDKTKGLRRNTMKYTISIREGQRHRTVTFYHQIKRNSSASYQIFRRINQELGLEGMFLYDRVGSKILADRTGKKVELLGVKVEKLI